MLKPTARYVLKIVPFLRFHSMHSSDLQTKIYKFEVAEYVLPKFDVSIETSKHHYYKDGKLRATIRSKYTYGRALKGEATVSVYPKTYGSFQPLISNLITRKVMKIDGKAFFEFDFKDELNFKEDYEQAIAIEAVVEEELTGRKQNTTMEIALHKSKYKIDFVKSSSAYKPGLPFAVTVSLTFSVSCGSVNHNVPCISRL